MPCWLQRERARQDALLDLAGHGKVALDVHQFGVLLLGALDVLDLLDGLVNGPLQVVQVNRLGGEIEGAAVHGVADVVHVSVCAHHDALPGRDTHLVDLGQKRQSVHFRHVDIREDDGNVRILQQELKRLQSVVGEVEFVFALSNLSAEELRQQQFEIGLVVDTQNFYGHRYI